MRMQPWDPWRELERLRAQTDRLWEEFLDKLRRTEPDRARIGFLPNLDLVETEQDFRVFLSVPGLVEEDIDVTVREDLLVVRGEREPPYDPQCHQGCITEWRYGAFERQIRFPGRVDPASLRARYDAGVLMIIVGKSLGGEP
jgi:HSP20 family protein